MTQVVYLATAHGVAARLTPEFERSFVLAAARAARRSASFVVGVVAAGADSAVEDRLRSVLRQTDTLVARDDGSWLLLAEDADPRSIDHLGRRLGEALRETPERAIGMALWESPKEDLARMIARAELALEEARRARQPYGPAGGALDPVGSAWGEPAQALRPATEGQSQVNAMQRVIGWLSLAALAWVGTTYAGWTSAETVLHNLGRALAFFRSLGGA